MAETEVTKQISPEMERTAARRARDRARTARWDLNVAVFLFAVLIIVMILLFQEIETEVVSPIAIFGLAMVWVVGWRRGRQLYPGFYEEELARVEQGVARQEKKIAEKRVEERIEERIEETIEEKVQKALRERWR